MGRWLKPLNEKPVENGLLNLVAPRTSRKRLAY